ncbi:MAG: GtrA family protein, partial [Gluconacetobacter diazotrophicus]|nr:GtrA family protein [Gluconacetobacter diazotrophicus]
AASLRASPILALAVQVMRFGTVGAFGFLWDYSACIALRPFVGLHLAMLGSFLVAATMNWLLNRLWTFRHCACRGSALRQWLTFLGANTLGFALNRSTGFLLIALFPACAAHPELPLAAGSLVGMCANFSLSRRVVFRAAPPA